MKRCKDLIEKLVRDKKLEGKTVGLVSLDFGYYEIAKALVACGIDICLVGNTEKKYRKGIAPIDSYSFEGFKRKYGEQAILIMFLYDYGRYVSAIRKNGWRINKTVFLDCEKKSMLKLGIWHLRSANNKMRFYLHTMPMIIRHCLFNAKRLGAVCYGFLIYQKIKRLYPDKKRPIYVYDYSGLGDVYVICLYLNGNEKELSSKDIILTVIGNGCKKVTDLFRLPNVKVLSSLESICLTYLSNIAGPDLDIHPSTPFPQHVFSDIYAHYLYGKRLNMAEVYAHVMLGIREARISYPNNDLRQNSNKLNNFFSENHQLQHGKTVIISPYANTVIGYPTSFWIMLIQKLKGLGFSVYTNCSGSEPEITGAPAFHFPLEIAEQVLNYAGFFVGIRSGFCDIICNTSAYKVIIYPEYEIFNSSVYDFCSFEKMKIGKSFREIQWDYSNLNELCEIITSAITEEFIGEE